MFNLLPKLRPYLPYALTVFIVSAILISLHYLFPQERIVEKEVIVEVVKEDKRITELLNMVEELQREVVRVKTAQTNERYRKWEHEETKPDGSKTRDAGEERNIDSVVTETEKIVEVKVVEVEKQVVVTQTVETVVEKTVEKIREPALKNWRVGPMVGVGFSVTNGAAFNGVVYGASLERRIIGPVWVGGWGVGNTALGGVVGLKATLEF